MAFDLHDTTALVTGTSRGIGAEVACQLAAHGANVVVNFRSKAPRAEEVAATIRTRGRRATLAQADLTLADDLAHMAHVVASEHQQLDMLILNASGGLEKGKSVDYAMQLNLTAQLGIVDVLLPLMAHGSRLVFVTSHWAHFYGQQPVIEAYAPIAASKKAGEDALRMRIPALAAHGVLLRVVSGDVIDGTITPKLLERMQPGAIDIRRAQVGALPTIADFARAIVAAAADSISPSGQTTFVGSTE